MKSTSYRRNDLFYPQNGTSEDHILRGSVFHQSREDLIDMYQFKSLSEYLSFEATNSTGDYALIDYSGEDHTVITSPGFSGAYIQTISGISVGRTLHSVLSDLRQDEVSISQQRLQLYIDNDQTDMLPHSTMFEQIYRLAPGTVLQIHDSSIIEQYSYVKSGKSSNSSLGQSLEEAVSTLSGVDKKITLMYSGGVDSTAFYYNLKEKLGEDRFRVVAIDIGPNTNSLSRAKSMGEQYGIAVEPIDFGWPPTDTDTLRIIEDALTKDLIDPLNPHWALHTENENQIVISGQNMDAMLTIDMHRPQTTYFNHLRATHDIFTVIKQLSSNFQYSELYRNSNILQILFSIIAPKILDGNTQGVGGREGYYLGQLSTGHPNIVDKFRSITKEELSHLSELLAALDPELVNYIQYQHNAAKLINTYSSQGTEIHLPSMWGPLATYCLNKPKTVTDALSPKKEIYDYVGRKSGIEYKKASYQSKDEYLSNLEKAQSHKQSMKSQLLQNNIGYFDPDESYVLNMIKSDSLTLREEYNEARNRIPQRIDINLINKYHRVLNMEKILESSLF